MQVGPLTGECSSAYSKTRTCRRLSIDHDLSRRESSAPTAGSLSHRTRSPLHYDRSARALTSEGYELFEITPVMLGVEMLLDEEMVIAMRDFPHYFGEVSSLTISACPLRRA